MAVTREHWGSKLGFIMAAAGSAVGLGNIWKFPYITGENGGAAFLILYLGLVFTIGISVLAAEMVIGRASQSDAITSFKKLETPGWSIIGIMGILAAFTILSFYGVIAGWTISYTLKMATGAFAGANGKDIETAFIGFISDPVSPLIYAGIFMLLTMLVVLGGIKGGIERAGKILMPLLFIILIALAVRGMTLPGAEAGIRFYLEPDFSKIDAKTVMAALGQAFFSLSLGMGVMITYGSYLNRAENLGRSSWYVAFLDTAVAILAGLAILPAVFAVGLNPAQGPALTFITLPAVFEAMPGGALFGSLFFFLLTIAALTSSISLLEPVVAYFNQKGFSRTKVTLASGVLAFLLGIPSSLSQGIWGDFTFAGKGFLDLMDFVSSSILLPVGGLLVSLYVGWVMGAKALNEMARGEGKSLVLFAWIFILRFIAPLAIAAILVNGLL
ncbi:sodium-dependent transporter [Kiloniella laminariae]|uniref:sodium-dependent transporter n=1 Tax=Kiloniella laminariae TaxID=454162 RepID=UPI00035DDB8D|nr:sodium-dependent transporter [Kiloniella laminariae]